MNVVITTNLAKKIMVIIDHIHLAALVSEELRARQKRLARRLLARMDVE